MSLRKKLKLTVSLLSLVIAVPSTALGTTVTIQDMISENDSLSSITAKKVKVTKIGSTIIQLGQPVRTETNYDLPVSSVYADVNDLKQRVLSHKSFQFIDTELKHKTDRFTPLVKDSFRTLNAQDFSDFYTTQAFQTFTNVLFQVALKHLISTSQNQLDADTGLNVKYTYNKRNQPSIFIVELGVNIPLYDNLRNSLYNSQSKVVDYDALTPYGQALNPQQQVTAQFIAKAFSVDMLAAFKHGLIRRNAKPQESIDEFWKASTGVNLTLQPYFEQWQTELNNNAAVQRNLIGIFNPDYDGTHAYDNYLLPMSKYHIGKAYDVVNQMRDSHKKWQTELNNNAAVQRNLIGFFRDNYDKEAHLYDRYLLHQSKYHLDEVSKVFNSLKENNTRYSRELGNLRQQHGEQIERLEAAHLNQVRVLQDRQNQLLEIDRDTKQALNTETVKKEQALIRQAEAEEALETFRKLHAEQLIQTEEDRQALQRLQEKLTAAQNETAKAQESQAKAEENTHKIQDLLSKAQEELEHQKRLVERQKIDIEELSHKEKQYQKSLELADAQIKNLSEEANTLKSKLAEQKETLRNAEKLSQQEVEKLQGQIVQTKEEADKLDVHVKKLEQERDQSLKDLEKVTYSLNQLEEEYRVLDMSAKEKEKKLTIKIESILKQAAIEKINLMEEIEKLHQRSKKQDAKIDLVNQRLAESLQNHEKYLEDTELRIQSYSIQIENLIAQKEKNEQEVMLLKAQLNSAQDRAKEADTLVREYKKTNEENFKKIIILEFQKEKITGELALVHPKLAELTEEAEKARVEKEVLTDLLAETELRVLQVEYRLNQVLKEQEMSSFSLSSILNNSPLRENQGIQTSFLGNFEQPKSKINDFFQDNIVDINAPMNFSGMNAKSELLHHEEKQVPLFKALEDYSIQKSIYEQEDSKGKIHERYQDSKGEWHSVEKSNVDGSFEILQNPDSFEENKHK